MRQVAGSAFRQRLDKTRLMATTKHEIGDVLFFSADGIAGEGTYIGTLNRILAWFVLVVGKHAIRFKASDCSGGKHNFSN